MCLNKNIYFVPYSKILSHKFAGSKFVLAIKELREKINQKDFHMVVEACEPLANVMTTLLVQKNKQRPHRVSSRVFVDPKTSVVDFLQEFDKILREEIPENEETANILIVAELWAIEMILKCYFTTAWFQKMMSERDVNFGEALLVRTVLDEPVLPIEYIKISDE